MASNFVAYAFSFAAGASLCAFYDNYMLEQDNFRTIAMDIIGKKEKEMREKEMREKEMRSDEFEALKQDIIALKQRLIVLENGKKARTTETGESD